MDATGLVVVSVVVGLVVGVLSGMLGIGGGTLLVPMFKLGYGMASIASTATSMFTIVFTSASGVVSHVRNKTCVPKLGIAAGIGGAVTSPVGVWLATKSPDWLIMLAAAVIIAYSSVTMVQKALKIPRGASDGQGLKGPSNSEEAPSSPVIPVPSGRQLSAGAAIGLVAGVASGYVGVGGGFIMIPLMSQLLHIPMKLASGTSLIAVMLLAIPSASYQVMLGNVNVIAGVAVVVGSIPGAMLGARILPHIPERSLRLLFAAVLLLAAVLLIVNQLGVMG